jgi:hypothetical protein
LAVQPDAHPSLIALQDLRDRLCDALHDGFPPESAQLAADLIEVERLAGWCRDAGLAWVRSGHPWGEIAAATGVPDATLQSRWKTWYERGGLAECG